MIGIRQKLMLAFGSLLAVVTVMGVMTLSQIDGLGLAVDVILKENFRSVVACQDMKEALERMDSGIVFTFSGNEAEGNHLIGQNMSKFRSALDVELDNLTLPGELERAQRIGTLFDEYRSAVSLVVQSSNSVEVRQTAYFSTLQPLFQEIKGLAQEILTMNQANMYEANNKARRMADSVHRKILAAMMIAALMALLFGYLVQRWILRPVNRLIESTNEIRCGNLDFVLEGGSGDEIGRLSKYFNEMTAALRQFRKEDRINLIRSRRATEEVFKALPEAIAVLDPDGRVEIATETADLRFGMRPGVLVGELGYEWIPSLIRKALDEGRIIEHDAKSGFIQQFVNGREYFFQPIAVPIPVSPERGEATGVALILKDVTQVHEQLELKRGVVSTVSHQLKTPLTSLRMSVYLLLEERIGSLNEKQTELLVAARDDSERLVGILDNLLDLDRIESGKAMVSPQPVLPRVLVQDAIDMFLVEARDRGVALVNAVTGELPEVMADAERMGHVLMNLFSNALRFTAPGGTVSVQASLEAGCVAFAVEDTGEGIAAEHIGHMFEQFYRAPGQDEKSGVGLGLAIVKEIVQTHGGEVSAESKIGKGSIFRFTLPLKENGHAAHSPPTMKE
ncbi:MAG: ATP-binding protein [Pseudomonadota bacterium]